MNRTPIQTFSRQGGKEPGRVDNNDRAELECVGIVLRSIDA